MKQPVTRIQQYKVAAGRRILVTSDIHGHLDYLRKVLEMAAFSEEDLLIIVGDMIEKGNNSLGTVRYIMELCKKGNVIPLIGNVDAYRLKLIGELCEENAEGFYQYLVKVRKWAGTSFYDELAKECGYEITSAEDVLAYRDEIVSHFEQEFRFLAELPTIVETQKFVFVHGGLQERTVTENEKEDLFRLTKADHFLSSTPHTFEKYVIVGHWPVALYNESILQMNPIIDREKKIISIDGGCGVKSIGQLNLLVIPEIECDIEEITSLYYDAFPVVTALEGQEAGKDPINIDWMNSDIQMLDPGEEFSLVQHCKSGRQLVVPNSCIYKGKECYGYTDYILHVEPGDELKLISTTSKGCMVKKDGVIGWYLGRYTGNPAAQNPAAG